MKKIILLALLLLSPLSARAELRVDITRGVIEPMPIAITAFAEAPGSTNGYGAQVPQVVAADLAGSGLFKPLDPQSFVQSSASIQADGVRFPEWRAIGTQALVTGTASQQPDGRTRVEFRLWDVFSQKQIAGMAYTTTPENWRRIAHIIADEIYKHLTGEDGYFDTRIVYVSESGPAQKRVKRLAIMDQDGQNSKYLTDGRELVLTPRFSPTQQQIAYMSYGAGGPKVYLYDISTGRHEPLGNFPGMTFSPRFSPDGRKVVMSLAVDGNTEVYEMDLGSRAKRRITNSTGIDTAPSYAPDGRRIVFESDRGGTQQLYTMNADGSNQQRITFGQGRYANPVWSPRGDLIAFTRMYQGKFYIGVIRPDGSGERLITNAYHVEGPTWSPNGRVLAYFKERPSGNSRQAKIYTVDITGYNERLLQTPQDASDPAWSPLNK
ncbi:MAG: Tol-Pal system beta propeller repeat protein TolB [Alphaproteobacteria bacterium]|nr:Tol-Pal system beta propeller repeat protein TolB [Alphaproteobacteria bacterium]